MITKDIEKELERNNRYSETMIGENAPSVLCDEIKRFMSEKNVSKADMIRLLNIDRNYGYLILKGARIPTRNCLIQMGLILRLAVDQINRLMLLADKSILYVRNPVDAKVFYAIKHNMEYYDAIDFIWGSDPMF